MTHNSNGIAPKPLPRQHRLWLEAQRRAYHSGTLSRDKITRMEQIPGFTWVLGAEVPNDPPAFYGERWRGWNQFLGIDPTSPEGQANIEQDRQDAQRLKRE